MRLKDKKALITGGGSGIGRATTLAFLREGSDVLAAIFEPGDEPPLREAARGLPGRLETAWGDVSVESDAKGLADAAVRIFGGLDILVNNAGVVVSGEATEVDSADWDYVMGVNAKGALYCCKHAIPHLLERGGGAIVNTASINAIRGNHRLVAYAASKGGVQAMTMAMALDYAARNIRVNCVCPATIEGTRMVDRTFDEAADRDRHRAYLLEKHPMGRLGKPEEVAAAILFLASDEASFITGQTLAIDGGRSIR
jgi:meso-butanediol dehydrogenase / (S,S)-butanediol dehydrogenase / diacetyl reductase